MITLEIDGKEAWYFPSSHSWLHDDRDVTQALNRTLPKREVRLHQRGPDPEQILSRALKPFPHAKIIKRK